MALPHSSVPTWTPKSSRIDLTLLDWTVAGMHWPHVSKWDWLVAIHDARSWLGFTAWSQHQQCHHPSRSATLQDQRQTKLIGNTCRQRLDCARRVRTGWETEHVANSRKVFANVCTREVGFVCARRFAGKTDMLRDANHFWLMY